MCIPYRPTSAISGREKAAEARLEAVRCIAGFGVSFSLNTLQGGALGAFALAHNVKMKAEIDIGLISLNLDAGVVHNLPPDLDLFLDPRQELLWRAAGERQAVVLKLFRRFP